MKTVRYVAMFLLFTAAASWAAIDLHSLDQAGNKRVPVASGVTMKIPANVERLFVQTKALSQRLQKAKIKPRIVERVRETAEQVIFTRQLKFEIASPQAFRQVFGAKPPRAIPRVRARAERLTGSPALTDAKLDRLVADFKRRCKPSNPLCAKPAAALKRLFRDHTGSYTVEEKVAVNKKPRFVDTKRLRLNLPKGAVVTAKPPKGVTKEVVPLQVSKTAKLPALARKVERIPGFAKELAVSKTAEKISPAMAGVNPRSGGTAQKGKKFLNGFTLGAEYSYTYTTRWKKWGTTVAGVTLWSYLGAGVGLRLPYEMLVAMAPTALEGGDEAKGFIVFKARDFSPADYEAVGLPSYQLFDGKEFVMRLGAQIGAKVVVLGKTVFDSYLGKLVDNSRDFTTPLGGERVYIDNVVLHGKDIGLFYGNTKSVYVEGNLRFDFHLVGQKMKFDLEGYHCTPRPERIAASHRDQEWTVRLTKIGQGVTERSKDAFGEYVPFGLTLKKPRYESDLAVSTSMNMITWINTDKLMGWIHVDTPWLHIYTFTLDMPSLKTHSDTSGEIALKGGRRYDAVRKESGGEPARSNGRAHGKSHGVKGGIEPLKASPGIQPVDPGKTQKKPVPMTSPLGM